MSRGLRVMVGSVGLAGHTLPALALARELRDRGHEVLFHGYERWRETAEGLGLRFDGGEDRLTSGAAPSDPGLAGEVGALVAAIEAFGPDAVVSDGLTLTPALAAEVAGIPRATLLPEVYPYDAPGRAPFSLGLLPPRTPLGSASWRALTALAATRLPTTSWLPASRESLNEARRALGLAALTDFSRPPADELTLVATLPQLEYQRSWPDNVEVTGPLMLDLPHPAVELPAGDAPLVFVAPSTAKDPEGLLLRAALEGLADERIRILVTLSGSRPRPPLEAPQNATVAEWVDYAQVMSRAALVICHGNHGTVARALTEGVPLAIGPAMADDAEHGARVAWAGAGVMVPRRLLTAASLRTAVRRVLADERFRERAAVIGAWSRAHDGAARAADLIEAHA